MGIRRSPERGRRSRRLLLGIRLEARLSWTALPEALGDDLVQLGLGLSFRLRVDATG